MNIFTPIFIEKTGLYGYELLYIPLD